MSEHSPFEFGTKAETLEKLAPLVKIASVPDLIHFSISEWQQNGADLLDKIAERFADHLIVVRSSAMSEDAEDKSMAGQFQSVLSVSPQDREMSLQAIETVVRSMPGDPRDIVLIQKMAENMAASGVIMTFDVSRGAPYYCIEFDDENGSTDAVTSGSGAHKSLYVLRNADRKYIKSKRIQAFLDLAQELEELCNCAAIDIEFGLDTNDKLHLFQVRRIVLARNWHPVTERRVTRQLGHLEAYLEDRSQPRDGLLGERTILGVMPDWNPAEIIGTKPRPLAASLYRYLITDEVWSRARAAMQYRDIGDTDLMALMGHQPYIDVRSSFNSFLPRGIEDAIGTKLVNAWLDRLERNPEFHDKVEFEIVPTCVDFTFTTDFADRYDGLLDREDFESYSARLTDLTRTALSPGLDNTLNIALAEVHDMSGLENLRLRPDRPFGSLCQARHLLQVCRQKGTLNFAIAARHAFIAETLLRSAVRRGALSKDRFDKFKLTIRTVSGDLLEDFASVSDRSTSRHDFFQKYGHLRPGTYEITSLRYDERGDDLFKDKIRRSVLPEPTVFSLTEGERSSLTDLLRETRLDVLSPDELIEHARVAIAARENIKFEFTKLLSDALSCILNWGYPNGLSRNDLSFLTWKDISNAISLPILDDTDRHFLEMSQTRRLALETEQTLKLAHIISRPRDIYVATLNRSMPNFVGLGMASGKVQVLGSNTSSAINLEDQIVCIENADPGFDWIFTKGLKALVTRFGGANSHMAVRCAELGIPAAIGCGDQIFERIAGATNAELNCTEQYLRPTHV